MAELTKQQTIELEHQLQVRRIWLEKALIGVIIFVIGFFANRMIESHKSGLADKSFLFESRVNALLEMRRSYDNLSTHLHFSVFEKEGGLSARRDRYLADLIEFTKHANQHAFLFPRRFGESINHHVWVHQATVEREETLIKQDQWGFAVDVFQHFDEMTRTKLDDIAGDTAVPGTRSRFRFHAAKVSDPDEDVVQAFLRTNLEKWERRISGQGEKP